MATKKQPKKDNEIRIKENDPGDEYFRRQDDASVLPPELNITVRDGFRFGIGFILASLIFYVILAVGVILLVKLGPLVKFTG